MSDIPDEKLAELKAEIEALLKRKGIPGRVLDRVNRHGETVVGVIIPPAQPDFGKQPK